VNSISCAYFSSVDVACALAYRIRA
jgi:hypothetical protein